MSDDQYRLMLAAVPFLFTSMFASAILLGRQRIGTVNILSLGATIASLVLLVVLVAIANLGVGGAIAAYLAIAVGGAIAALVVVARIRDERPQFALRASELLRYGFRIIPGSIATFFGYRADVFLIGAILASPREVGLYSLAVGFAELVFYVPDSIATAFFPKVASVSPAEAGAFAPAVARQTVLLATIAAAALLPSASLAIVVLLPAFLGSIPALLVLTPAVLALSISKVLSGYVSGLGMPLHVGSVAAVSVVLNLAANVVLIPRLGITGAALASLLSYTTNAILMIVIATRFSGVPAANIVVPGMEDVATLVNLGRALLPRRLADRLRAIGGR